MHGVPADLNLSKFNSATLIQICIGEHQIQFHFHPEGSVCVEGRWELIDSGGNLVDAAADTNSGREAFSVHRILGQSVESYSIDPPHSISLRFASGHRLHIFDDSQQYESFSIQPGNIIV
jgi:hypothetical protein